MVFFGISFVGLEAKGSTAGRVVGGEKGTKERPCKHCNPLCGEPHTS